MRFGDAKIIPFISIDSQSVGAPATLHTDAERLASAKARAMQLQKDSRESFGGYPPAYPREYYEDFCGNETSAYVFNQLLFILYFLKDPKFEAASLNERDGYDRRTGIWTRVGSQVSIRELKNAVAARIAELGISEVLLLEHLAVPHGIAEHQRFWAMDFPEQMDRFRVRKDRRLDEPKRD